MGNIVRVYEHKPLSSWTSPRSMQRYPWAPPTNGAAANIRAGALRTSTSIINGRTGSAGGTVQYSETPTIRYIPLLGQALVAQLVTPVSVDALGLLYDSNWPAAPLLDFASAYLTLDYGEFYDALNTIIELDDDSALELAAAKSELPKSSQPEQSIKTPSAAGPGGNTTQKSQATVNENDSLMIYLRPFHPHAANVGPDQKRRVLQLWIRLLRIYIGSQPAF